jgi:acetyl-CoA acetyltransferase
MPTSTKDGLHTGLRMIADDLWADSGVGDERIVSRKLPVNTSGGQFSAGQAEAAGGMHGIVEVVTQLRRRAGMRQVTDARLGLVTGYGMVAYRYGACANAAVLERAA